MGGSGEVSFICFIGFKRTYEVLAHLTEVSFSSNLNIIRVVQMMAERGHQEFEINCEPISL